jgi:hypothetical protein
VIPRAVPTDERSDHKIKGRPVEEVKPCEVKPAESITEKPNEIIQGEKENGTRPFAEDKLREIDSLPSIE